MRLIQIYHRIVLSIVIYKILGKNIFYTCILLLEYVLFSILDTIYFAYIHKFKVILFVTFDNGILALSQIKVSYAEFCWPRRHHTDKFGAYKVYARKRPEMIVSEIKSILRSF